MKEYTFLFKNNMVVYTPKQEYLTMEDMSNITGIQARSIKRWINEDGLLATLVDGEYRVKPADFETFLACKTRKKSGKRSLVY